MLFTVDADLSYTNPFDGTALNPGVGGAGTNNQLDLWLNGSNIAWNTGEGSNNRFVTTAGASVTWTEYNGLWTHIAVVNNSLTLSASLFINGHLKGTAAYRNTITDNGNYDLSIGGYVGGSNAYNYKGEIDDFRIYTGSLSNKQIESIYLSPDAGVSRTIIDGDSISSGHLRSNNWGPSYGSEYNLNDGTFYLGGSANPALSWNGTTLLLGGSDQVTAAMVSESLQNATSSLVTMGSTGSLENPLLYAFGSAASHSLSTGNAGVGLNLTSTHLGYYNNSAWQSYMDSTGNFYLGGTEGALQWNAATDNLVVLGEIEVSNPSEFNGPTMNHNFGGPSGSVIAQSKLIPDGDGTGSQWMQKWPTTGHRIENGVLFLSSSNATSWNGELRSKQTFNRTDDHTFVADITITSLSANHVMLGFGDRANTPIESTVNGTFANGAHQIYIAGGTIRTYEGSSQVPGTSHYASVAASDKLRILIKPNIESDGARYQVFKHPNLSGSIVDVNTVGVTNAKQDQLLDVGIWAYNTSENFHIDNIQVTAPGVSSTVIEGDKITTGLIRSSNLSTSAGSVFNLNDGTFKLGGTDAPNTKLEWNGTTLKVKGEITIESGDLAGVTAASISGSSNEASASLALYAVTVSSSLASGVTTAQVQADAANAIGNLAVSQSFNQWVTASLEQLKESSANGRGLYQTPSYHTNTPLTLIYDSSPLDGGSWPTTTTYAGSTKYTFTSPTACSGSIRFVARDGEGAANSGFRVAVNSASVSPNTPNEIFLNQNHANTTNGPIFVLDSQASTDSNLWNIKPGLSIHGQSSGTAVTTDNIYAYYEHQIHIRAGLNEIAFWSKTGDGGDVKRVAAFRQGNPPGGQIVMNDAPEGAGLYLGNQHLGFYGGSDWKTYMSASGDFFLGGQGGALTWDESANQLNVKGNIVIENPVGLGDNLVLDADFEYTASEWDNGSYQDKSNRYWYHNGEGTAVAKKVSVKNTFGNALTASQGQNVFRILNISEYIMSLGCC